MTLRTAEDPRHGVSLTVNGKPITASVDPRTLLVELIREELRLTGTHVGCDTSQCGACVVEFDGDSVKSCTMLAVQADGGDVTTIEGLAQNGKLHPLQEAWVQHGGSQCGFCTPGMIMMAKALLDENPHPTEEEVREGISGNLCRCTGYVKIVEAILAASQKM